MTDPRHSDVMTPLAWLVGFWLPACGASGAGGLPRPTLLDMTHIQRPASPNAALAAPAEADPKPDIVTLPFQESPSRLYDDVLSVATHQPRTYLAAEYPVEGQAHFVARSALFNFPDLITAQVGDAGRGASTLILYSRSVYGYSDLGVNRKRLTTWLAALQTQINHPVRDDHR